MFILGHHEFYTARGGDSQQNGAHVDTVIASAAKQPLCNMGLPQTRLLHFLRNDRYYTDPVIGKIKNGFLD
ncbi:MAG TPA: hypothetical protein PLL36_14040, partial [Candidatus Hydrogenedentes bacterium]|nr:hypothetical protein [Candidatus Hydrogenedentota bacterium]